jgi:hypothetical protein
MAKRKIVVSDISGEEVTEDNAASVRITYAGSDKVRTLDVTVTEADELFTGGTESKKRGRKANGPAPTRTSK